MTILIKILLWAGIARVQGETTDGLEHQEIGDSNEWGQVQELPAFHTQKLLSYSDAHCFGPKQTLHHL